MADLTRSVNYRCSDDCRAEGCPGHLGILNWQSVSDAYSFSMNGRILHFERGELDAMVELLRSLNRADSVQVDATPTPDASGERDGEWSAIGPDMNDEGDK